MKFCYYYWLIEPLRGGFSDKPSVKSEFRIPIKFDSENIYFSLYNDPKKQPLFAKLEIPNITKDEIPEKYLSLIQNVKEHLLATLKLTIGFDAKLFSRPF